MNDNFFSKKAPPIDEEHLKALIDNPPMLCGECDCPRDSTGNYCKCIRSVFEHEEHYLLYLKLVKQKIESAFVDLIRKNN